MISRLFQIPEGFIVNLGALLNALPGAVAQGLIWGIMSIGVYITYKVLDLADLTVDGSMATGGAVCVMLMLNGCNVWLALLCAVIAGSRGHLEYTADERADGRFMALERGIDHDG